MNVRHPGPVTAVRVFAGPLDFASAPALFEDVDAVCRSGIDRLVLDLARVTDVDSTGLAVLVQARNRSLQLEFDLHLRRVPERVVKLLAITGLDRVLNFDQLADDDSDAQENRP